MSEEDYEFLSIAMAHSLVPERAETPGMAVQSSTEALCWWCRIDPVDGTMSGLAHPDYRYLCRKCRQIMEIFASHYARLQELAMPSAREQFMRFVGIRCVAMKLEMQEMRERVDELLHAAHKRAAWINGLPDERTRGAGEWADMLERYGKEQKRLSHAPRVEIPVHVKKDVE